MRRMLLSLVLVLTLVVAGSTALLAQAPNLTAFTITDVQIQESISLFGTPYYELRLTGTVPDGSAHTVTVSINRIR